MKLSTGEKLENVNKSVDNVDKCEKASKYGHEKSG